MILDCFRSLQTYMVLKRGCDMEVEQGSFRSLQTYMVLKLRGCMSKRLTVLDPYKLTWFSNRN